jgi:hypothetical protein
MTTSPAGFEVSWFWDWVPAADTDAEERAVWSRSVARMLDDWVGAKVAGARAAWPDDAEEEFPFTVEDMGAAVAHDLLERADGLPDHCRVIWGAGFVGDEARWLPQLVLAEFRSARPEDPSYLMAMVGAEGFSDDVRDPVVEYLTTEHGDGVRVFALARSADGGVHARVHAALRLEGGHAPGGPVPDVDVLLTTRVEDMDRFAVIGPGVDALMTMIADRFAAAPGDGSAPLRFAQPAGADLP